MTKLKKTGMPVTSVEAAQQWRMANVNAYTGGEREPGKVNAVNAVNAPPVNDSQTSAAVDDTPAAPTYSGARARREHAEAQIAEIELAKLSGALVDRFVVERAVFDAFRQLRDAVIAAAPRVSPQLFGLTDLREIEQTIVAELRKALSGWEERMVDRLAAHEAWR